MKKGNLELAEEKSIMDKTNLKLTKELIEKNSQQRKENSKLEEKVQKLKEESKEVCQEENAQIEGKKPALEREIQKPVEEKNVDAEEKFCAPKTNIMFLRTHKTGSTTMLALFQRFADNNQLTIAKKVHPHEAKKFHRCTIYPVKAGYQNNIFAEHTIFNYEEMKDTMPEGTIFLTILRDPVAQFESTYGYFSLEKMYGMNLTAFADLDTSLPDWSRLKNLRFNYKNGINPNAHDLRIDLELFEDEEFILQKVQEFDRQFHLVLITDLFDESVILMKEKLCWKELIEVAYMKTKTRISDVKVHLSSERKMKLREKNRADQMIYDHFYQKLLGQIDAFGKEKMAEEVKKLRALTEEIDEVCVEKSLPSKANGKITTKFRARAAKTHKVCRSIMPDRKSSKKFLKSKFEKAIECEN